ncbi:hypothetical protein [Commensalibacter nepenthis]|uniref:Uncharacterized protein n=1 Tax=Commensalibacter nepenthis TaxID=3043872 RepID=A0ABT6QAV4_9PROT|nr:hypothetical protein [Commensalibacter sp. TBRC 10068]MDI2113926.1 hypothetical protein [Commensalibacter sp. TBRC 10068]
MTYECPELDEKIFQEAASLLQRQQWFSEYNGPKFYTKSIIRQFTNLIVRKLSEISTIPSENLQYIEENVNGVNGWAFYDDREIELMDARKILRDETRRGNGL